MNREELAQGRHATIHLLGVNDAPFTEVRIAQDVCVDHAQRGAVVKVELENLVGIVQEWPCRLATAGAQSTFHSRDHRVTR